MHALNIVAIWASLQAIVCAAPGFGQIQPQAEYDVDYCKGSDYEGCRRIEGPYDQCINLRDIAPDYNNEISSLIVYGQGSCMTWVDDNCKGKRVRFHANQNLAQNCGKSGCMDNRISSYTCNR